MFKCMSPDTIRIELEWDQCLPLAKAHGFEGIDARIDLKRSPSSYRDRLAEHGLKAGGVPLPFPLRSDSRTFEEGIASFPDVVRCAAEAGYRRFRTWVPPFSDELPYREHFKLQADRCRRLAKIMADHGCVFALEFVAPRKSRMGHKYSFIHTSQQLLDLCEAAGPNTGLLLDSWHWHTSLGIVEDILCLQNSQVVYVHVNDAPAGIPIENQNDKVRALPGATGVIDIAAFMEALRKIGYDGPVAPEPMMKELASLPPEETARRAGAAMEKIWNLTSPA